jgi:hypothetical protein
MAPRALVLLVWLHAGGRVRPPYTWNLRQRLTLTHPLPGHDRVSL